MSSRKNLRLSREEKKEALRRRNAERDARKAGGIGAFALLDLEKFDNPLIYELKEGYNYIDNLPYEVTTENHPDQIPIGEDDYKLEAWAHRNVGPNNEWVLCTKRTFNKRCRCCEERDYLQTKEGGGYTKDDPEVKALTPTLRCFYNVLDVSEDAKTDEIQLFENAGASKPSKWFEALLNEEAKAGREEPIAWYDIEEGFTIKVRAEVDSYQKNEFIKPTRIDFEDRDPYDEDIYDEVYPLDAMLKIPTYEDQCRLFELGQSRDDEDGEDRDNDDDDAKSSKRRSGGRSSNRSRMRASEKTSNKENESRSRRRKSKTEEYDDPEDDSKPTGRGRNRRTNKKSGRSERDKGQRKRRGKVREKEEEISEEPEEEELGVCPYDFTFGVDHNQKDACVDCDDETWDSCSEASRMVKIEKNKENGGRRRSTNKGRR
jgi:hypothetical protein